MKLPKRLPYEVLIAASVMLGSCDQMPHSFTNADHERLEIADVNGRNAIYKAGELGSHIDDLEERLKAVEGRLGM